jgi:hypothetical protein
MYLSQITLYAFGLKLKPGGGATFNPTGARNVVELESNNNGEKAVQRDSESDYAHRRREREKSTWRG